MSRSLARSAALATAVGLSAVLGAGTASAHITTEPSIGSKGGTATFALRVPNERPNAGTVKVTLHLPMEHPLSTVRTSPTPGWDISVDTARLPAPVETQGVRLTETVRTITWTAKPGQRIAPDQFQEFDVQLGDLPSEVEEYVMRADQTYESGEVVRWEQPIPESGEEPAYPAPMLTLVEDRSGGGGHHGGSSSTGGALLTSYDNTARWLGGAGLIIGALGLGLGGGAILRGRRSADQDGKGTR